MSGSDRPLLVPQLWLPVIAPATGRAAIVVYLRAHLYGAAVGRQLLERCIDSVDHPDRIRLIPLRGQFDAEIATARRVLSSLSWIGTPGRQLVSVATWGALAALPAGPKIVDPLARLAVLETLRTVVVAKSSMWDLLATVDQLGAENLPEFADLAHQARAQGELLESLRVNYGHAALE